MSASEEFLQGLGDDRRDRAARRAGVLPHRDGQTVGQRVRRVALIASHAGTRVVHLFDTFDGLPAPAQGDNSKFQAGDFRSQMESVQAYLAGLNCRFHKGLFPDSAAPLPCAGQPQPGSAMPCDLRAQRRAA